MLETPNQLEKLDQELILKALIILEKRGFGATTEEQLSKILKLNTPNVDKITTTQHKQTHTKKNERTYNDCA